MMTIKQPRRRARRRLLGAVAALGATTATVASAGGHADAAFIDVYLHPIERLSGDLCVARVGTDINMSYADALSFIAHPGEEATVKLRGDDPIWDNSLIALPVDAPTWPQAWAGGYSVEFTRLFSCHILNEDWNDPEDEIYAQVTFQDFRTGQTHRANSAVTVGDF